MSPALAGLLSILDILINDNSYLKSFFYKKKNGTICYCQERRFYERCFCKSKG